MNLAQQNDFLRRHLTAPCCVMTASVAANPDRVLILAAVREFQTFNNDNDPHGKHDFGRFTVNAKTYFFKWDYYDASFEHRPNDGEPRFHVLTIGSCSSDF